MTDKATSQELKGKERSLANLKPIQSLTDEEKHNLAVLGGKARGKQQQQQKTMRETMLTLLKTKISRETAEKYLGDDAELLPEEELTYQGIMSAKMWQEASMNGNAKAAEFVRDTSGQRPKDVVELSADITTDSDRALMADIAERLGIMPKKSEE